jgi:phage terminase large subunit-like protein
VKVPEFVAWSESPIGFYVNQSYDVKRGLWVIGDAPIVWDERQRQALRHIFRVDKDKRLRYSRVVWVDIGKSAKTLMGAAVTDWLGRYFEDEAELLVVANSKEQADVRMFASLRDSLLRNPHVKQFCDLEDRAAMKITYTDTGNIVRPVATKAKSQSGSNAICIAIDEMWGYEGDTSRALLAEMKPSPTRNVSLVLTTTYPGFVDDDGPLNDILDEFFNAEGVAKEGVKKVAGLEKLPLWERDNTVLWWNHEPYAWHTRKMPSGKTFLQEQRDDPMMSESHYLRIWEARRTQRRDVYVPLDLWDMCEDTEWHGLSTLDRNVPVVVGVDIGRKFASTAVIVRGYDTVTRKYVLMAHRIWGPGQVQAQETDVIAVVIQYIMDLTRQQRVLAVYFDPWQMYHAAERLKKLGVNMVECTQNNRRIVADSQYRGLIMQRLLRNYSQSRDLRDHVANVVGREVGMGSIRFDKKRTDKDIDGAVADSMACLGITEHLSEFERLERLRRHPTRPQSRRNYYREVFYGKPKTRKPGMG